MRQATRIDSSSNAMEETVRIVLQAGQERETSAEELALREKADRRVQ